MSVGNSDNPWSTMNNNRYIISNIQTIYASIAQTDHGRFVQQRTLRYSKLLERHTPINFSLRPIDLLE